MYPCALRLEAVAGEVNSVASLDLILEDYQMHLCPLHSQQRLPMYFTNLSLLDCNVILVFGVQYSNWAFTYLATCSPH